MTSCNTQREIKEDSNGTQQTKSLLYNFFFCLSHLESHAALDLSASLYIYIVYISVVQCMLLDDVQVEYKCSCSSANPKRPQLKVSYARLSISSYYIIYIIRSCIVGR
jgi:hypothetical protein